MTGWHAALQLDYQRKADRTDVMHAHNGPLRVLKSLYPEGPAICHTVLVHPPSGLVGGDRIDIRLTVHPKAHALVTTPGATRFYRTEKGLAAQEVVAKVSHDARLEWLPLETIAYNNCQGLNKVVFDIDTGGELIAWDITALGLPVASLPFVQGQLQQHMEIKDAWLERGLLDASDQRLMSGPLGLANHRCSATLVLASGSDMTRDKRDLALSLARDVVSRHGEGVVAGVTSPHPRVVVMRALSPLVEPTQTLFRAVWAAWRTGLWEIQNTPPRIWTM
jgi:urease accessory protein